MNMTCRATSDYPGYNFLVAIVNKRNVVLYGEDERIDNGRATP